MTSKEYIKNLEKCECLPLLSADYIPSSEIKKSNIVCLRKKPDGYPERFLVTSGTTWENVDFEKYKPIYYEAEKLKYANWAEPGDLKLLNNREFVSFEGKILVDKNGRPLNPWGPTGIEGRGGLGKWGANCAADALADRVTDKDFLEIGVILRECGLWAIPGGMIEKGETVFDTLNKEFWEEVTNKLDFRKAKMVHQGYVDDIRNTDNAWIETNVFNYHLDYETGKSMVLVPGDDARDAKWMVCTKNNIELMYANHPNFVKDMIYKFQKDNNCMVLENGKVVYLERAA